MADVATLREALLAAGLRTREEAESALDAGEHPLLHENLRSTFGSGTGCATATCFSSLGITVAA